MKKITIIVLVLIIGLSNIFALDNTQIIKYPEIVDFAFKPTISRINAMGGAGIGSGRASDSLFYNPADITDNTFGLKLPSISFTLYNAKEILSDPHNLQYIEALAEGGDGLQYSTPLAMNLLSYLGSNKGALMAADAGIGIYIGSFGISADTRIKIHSLNPSGGSTTALIIPELNFAGSIGTGVRIIDSSKLTVDAGVSAHFAFKAYFKGQDLTSTLQLIDMGENSEFDITGIPVMAGYALPIDAGINVGFLDNTLKLSFTANNINGNYFMKSYPGFEYLLDDLDLIENQDVECINPKEFDIKIPIEYNFGITFAPSIRNLNPIFTLNLVDFDEFVKKVSKNNPDYERLFADHAIYGMEINLFRFVNLRAGVNRGYVSVGAGFGLLGVRIEADYNWQEFGRKLGDKPVDSLTVRFNFGMDCL